MRDKGTGEEANRIAETQNNLSQRSKCLVFDFKFPDLFPQLLNRIYFRRIGRDKEEADIIRDTQSLRFMPSRAITAEQNQVILVLFGQHLQKSVGADGIVVWQHQKAAFTGSWLNSPIGVEMFTDMMTWNCRPDVLLTPAVFGFIENARK